MEVTVELDLEVLTGFTAMYSKGWNCNPIGVREAWGVFNKKVSSSDWKRQRLFKE